MISIEEIKHLEELSKLQFSEEEREKFQKEFDAIIDFASQISNADVDSGKSFIKTIKMQDLSEDEIKPSLPQDQVILNAPSKKKGCFAVPKIMD